MNKITVERVVKRFQTKLAVAEVSFEVERGKVFGLLGPNGAGKTTLIRMLIDIIRPDSGTVLYDGRPLQSGDKDRITYLPEERGLYRKERVQDTLEYFARLKGLSKPQARSRAVAYLEKLEMTPVANARIEELSKGNQQKIQIAATLVSDPDVIILDEPFTGLDPINVRLAKALLAEERRNGKTILLSTHQMNQVEELCDCLLMVHNGRQVLYGPVEEIVRRFSDGALVVECSGLDGPIPEIERVVDNGKYRKIYPRPGVTPTALLRALLERGVEIDRFQRAATPLEDIFVKVVRESGEGAV